MIDSVARASFNIYPFGFLPGMVDTISYKNNIRNLSQFEADVESSKTTVV